ncbi:hypothetical protein PEC301653_07200 [Pectobacterium carotovorum subsp. carotovorum]|nr:hypothetical protein PEC301653_07200 [Pectobacterium carotovorum subsp. carotovorum]
MYKYRTIMGGEYVWLVNQTWHKNELFSIGC